MQKVQFFATCLVDTFFPSIGEAAVRILRRLGCTVEFPRSQTCCGQPLFNAGMRVQSRATAEHMLRTFEAADGDVVVPSGSCAHMLRHGYPELFREEARLQERAEALAKRVFEFTEYLVDHLGVVDVGAGWDGTLTYHASCHTLRGIGVDRQPRMLLANVRGSRLVDLPEREDCCGFGGVFSLEHPEISREMLQRKIANLEASGASTLVLTEPGCLMHIAGGLLRVSKTQQVRHIAEVLAHSSD